MVKKEERIFNAKGRNVLRGGTEIKQTKPEKGKEIGDRRLLPWNWFCELKRCKKPVQEPYIYEVCWVEKHHFG